MSRGKMVEVNRKDLAELIENAGGKVKVATLLETTINTVYKWVQHEKLPALKYDKLINIKDKVPLLNEASDGALVAELNRRGLLQVSA